MTQSIRILLVDDETLVLSALRRVLVRRGFEVETANSGPDALRRLETATYEIVLSDYKMPGMTGAELLREIAVRWPAIHRCLLTAQADPEVLAAAKADGTIHHAFRKPWDNAELVAALKLVAAS
ncbi:MAG: response regulator [Planctomycetota bacterium]|nr:response regulator [Planctomycetota bacterium]